MECQGRRPKKNILGFLILAGVVVATSVGIGFVWYYIFGLTYSMWFPLLAGVVGISLIAIVYPWLHRRGML